MIFNRPARRWCMNPLSAPIRRVALVHDFHPCTTVSPRAATWRAWVPRCPRPRPGHPPRPRERLQPERRGAREGQSARCEPGLGSGVGGGLRHGPAARWRRWARCRTIACYVTYTQRARHESSLPIDQAIRDRLAAMVTDFHHLWSDPSTPSRERKRMLAHLVEDVTLVKYPNNGTTKIHVRFRGGQTTTLTTVNPRPSWAQVKTAPEIVDLVDQLLEDQSYDEVAHSLNTRGLRPGGAARPGRHDTQFTAAHVRYLVHTYRLRPRFDRLRARGMHTKKELAERLGIHESTLTSWVAHGIIKAYAYNGHAWLYEEPLSHPTKHCSRWDRLDDRAAAVRARQDLNQDPRLEVKEV